MEEMKNDEQACQTKAELMEKLDEQKQINDDLRAEVTMLKKDKDYWYDAWRKEFGKTEAFEKRLKKMQHAIALLASTIGEIDITALAKEENV